MVQLVIILAGSEAKPPRILTSTGTVEVSTGTKLNIEMHTPRKTIEIEGYKGLAWPAESDFGTAWVPMLPAHSVGIDMPGGPLRHYLTTQEVQALAKALGHEVTQNTLIQNARKEPVALLKSYKIRKGRQRHHYVFTAQDARDYVEKMLHVYPLKD
jgi:hypothetical protein